MIQESAVYPPFKNVYLYDPETGLFAGIYPAQLSPEDSPGTYLTPVCSTDVVPPAAGIDQVAQFVGSNWVLTPDFRGQTWYDQTSGAAVEITAIGQPATNLAPTPPPPTLAQAQESASNTIDAQAGFTRAKYITTVAGQSETYQAKLMDANAYKAAGYPYASITSYPWINAEAIAVYGSAFTAAQTQAAADTIIATAAAWTVKGAQIEQARRAGAVAVAAAATVAGVEAAQAAAIAALEAM